VKIGGDEEKIESFQPLLDIMWDLITNVTLVSQACINGPLEELKEKINSSNINSRTKYGV